MGLITSEDDGGLVISGEKVPIAAYQAIYHRLTRRVEKLTRVFDEGYAIRVDDLRNLNERLEQLIQQFGVQGSRCQVTHSAKDSYTNTYSSFEKFLLADKASMDCTSSLGYEFDFMIILPSGIPEAKEIAQRFKLELTFEQEFINSDDIGVPYFFRHLTNIGQLKMTLEYSDYSVAQSLDAVVKGWLNTLNRTKKTVFTKFLGKIEGPIHSYFGSILRLVPLFAGTLGALKASPMSAASAASYILFFFSLGHIGYTFGEFLARQFFKVIRAFSIAPMVLITRGDEDRAMDVNKKKLRAKSILGLLAIAGVFAVVVNLLSSWIYDVTFAPLLR